MVRLRYIALLLAVLALAASASDLTIKVEVRNVAVDVFVTDRKGHHVSGLTKEQFSISEDGVPQQIVSFKTGRTNLSQPPKDPASRTSNQAAAPVAEDPPVQQSITLLIDLGGLQPQNLNIACSSAAKYVEKALAAGNLVSIYWVDSSLHLAVPLTSDKARLLAVLDKLRAHVPAGRLTASDRISAQNRIEDLFDTIHPQVKYGGVASSTDSGGGSISASLKIEMNILRSWLVIASRDQAEAIFMSLRALSLAYTDRPGRKTVVVFSEGFLHAGDAAREMRAAVDAANRAGVTFYVIDASGATSRMTSGVRVPDTSGTRSNPDTQVDDFVPTLGLNAFDWSATLASDVHADLGEVARATGGFLVSDTNDLAAAFDRIERDGSEFYTLAYQPANTTYDGAFRKIKVTLNAKGYRLRFRQGYWAIPPGREVLLTPGGAQLLHAIETGDHSSAFTPNLRAAFVQARDGRFAVPVSLSMPGSSVPFDKKKDHYSSNVTMLLLARDKDNKLISVYERYGNLQFTQQDWKAFQRTLFNVNGHLPVPALESMTVQGIVQFANGDLGISPQTPLTTASPESGILLTSLVLSNRLEQADCAADLTDPLCVKNLRVYFPSRASFTPSERLVLYFTALHLEVDSNTKQPALQVSFDLLSGESASPLKPDRIQSVPGAAPNSLSVLAMFNLSSLMPGNYKLRANATDTIASKQVVSEAAFTVE